MSKIVQFQVVDDDGYEDSTKKQLFVLTDDGRLFLAPFDQKVDMISRSFEVTPQIKSSKAG